jgi:hypothetical protein
MQYWTPTLPPKFGATYLVEGLTETAFGSCSEGQILNLANYLIAVKIVSMSSAEHPDTPSSPEDRQAILRREEAVVALSKYLRQRAAGLSDSPGEKKVYEHNDRFPFPILDTAYEIAELVLNSAGSFGMDDTAAPETSAADPENP